MRFYLQLRLDKPELPLEYRKLIISFIKYCLSVNKDRNLLEFFYNNTEQKAFTWSIELNQPRFKQDKVVLKDTNVRLKFAASEQNMTAFLLFQAFLSQKNKKYNVVNNGIKIEQIVQQREYIITSTSCIFTTAIGSPLCIRLHDRVTNHDRYLTFQEKEFESTTTIFLKEQALQKGFSQEECKKIAFHWLNGKKTVIKHYNHRIDASIGAFRLDGPPLFLQMIYQTGFLGRKSEGFNMLDLVAQQVSVSS